MPINALKRMLLTEKLDVSQYRKYVKEYNRERYGKIFGNKQNI